MNVIYQIVRQLTNISHKRLRAIWAWRLRLDTSVVQQLVVHSYQAKQILGLISSVLRLLG